LDSFKDPQSASKSNKNDGLLVLGVFVRVGQHNDDFDHLISYLNDIHLKDHHVPVHNINLKKLMPLNLMDYWAYKGSLTTPVCYHFKK
jgi:carbonic anhydrase